MCQNEYICIFVLCSVCVLLNSNIYYIFLNHSFSRYSLFFGVVVVVVFVVVTSNSLLGFVVSFVVVSCMLN